MASALQRQENPFVVITEQPQSKALRFRYECEGRSAGSIPGVNSTPAQKTFPSIEIRGGYKGRAVVVVSCVTKDPPYRAHPHSLVGKEGCKDGVCKVEINSNTMSYTFSNLGVQCVKKKDIEDSLKKREKMRINPFNTGFAHSKQPATIDLNAVRLCFQVIIEDLSGKFTEALKPVVSDVIYDKKAMCELVICKLSHMTAPTIGGKEIILLCEKVAKDDISVRFYEEHNGNIVWEDVGEFQHNNVHKQVAICFRTPRYRTVEVTKSVMVYIQLRRPSDGATSEPLPFELLPVDSSGGLSQKRKLPKFNSSEVLDQAQGRMYGQMILTPNEPIKAEPRDQLYAAFQGPYRNPNEPTSPAERSSVLPVYANPTNNAPYNPAVDFYQLNNDPQYYQPYNDPQYYQQYNDPQYNFPRNNAGHHPTYQHPLNLPQCQYMVPGPSGVNFHQQHQLPVDPSEYNNLGSLQDIDLSELRNFMMGHASNAAEGGQQQANQTRQQNDNDEQHLSDSLTRLRMNPLNDLNK